MKTLRSVFVLFVVFFTFALYAQDEAPNEGFWTSKTPMNTARRYLGAATVGGKVYVIGGYNGSYLGTNECYDPVLDSWTNKSPMPTPRNGAAVVALNGKVYVIGGYNGTYLNTTEVYDPITDSWATKANMPTARRYVAGAALGGLIYVVGGYDGSPTNETEVYNPSTDTWSTKAPINTSRYGLGVAAVGGKLYAVGGYASAGYSKRIEEYDPESNTWSYKTNMAVGRSGVAVVAFSGRLYMIGGSLSGSVQTAAVDEYIISSNSWATRDSMLNVRTQLAAVVVNNRIYAFGGSRSGTGNAYLAENDEYTPPRFCSYAGEAVPGKIIVTTYMSGIAFSLSATEWDIGMCRPNENKYSSAFELQNDGGVNLDLGFRVQADDYGGPYPWTAWNNPAPFIDTVYFALVVTDAGVASVTGAAFGDPQDAVYESPDYIEANNTVYAPNDATAPYAGVNADGLNLVAYEPGNNDGDELKLWFKFIATASARDPGSTGTPHSLIVNIAAKLSDTGGW